MAKKHPGFRAVAAKIASKEGDNGPIKIGRGQDPKRRLSDCQVGNAEELRLLASQGSLNDSEAEANLHKRLRAHHVRGEWFRPHPEVLAVVEEMKKPQPTLQEYALQIVADYKAAVLQYNLARLLKWWEAKNAKPVHQG